MRFIRLATEGRERQFSKSGGCGNVSRRTVMRFVRTLTRRRRRQLQQTWCVRARAETRRWHRRRQSQAACGEQCLCGHSAVVAEASEAISESLLWRRASGISAMARRQQLRKRAATKFVRTFGDGGGGANLSFSKLAAYKRERRLSDGSGSGNVSKLAATRFMQTLAMAAVAASSSRRRSASGNSTMAAAASCL